MSEEAASTEPVEQTEPAEAPVDATPEAAPKEYRGDDYSSGPVELPVGENEMPPLTPEPMPELGPDDVRPDLGDDPEADLARLRELDQEQLDKVEPMKVSTMEPGLPAPQPVAQKEKPKLRSQGVAQRMPAEPQGVEGPTSGHA